METEELISGTVLADYRFRKKVSCRETAKKSLPEIGGFLFWLMPPIGYFSNQFLFGKSISTKQAVAGDPVYFVGC